VTDEGNVELLADRAHVFGVGAARRTRVMIDVVHGDDQPRFEGEQKQSEGVRSPGDREVHGR
jgi:hypothetical protein